MPRTITVLCSVLGLMLCGQVGADDDDDAPATTSVDTARPALSVAQQLSLIHI